MVDQTVFSPLGLAQQSKNGLFITPLRIFRTTRETTQKKSCILIEPDNIDHSAKRANKKSMEYYIETKTAEIKNGLLTKLLKQYYHRDYVFDWETDSEKKIPLSVTVKYNESIVAYKNKSLLNYAQENFLRYIYMLERSNRYLLLKNKEDPNNQSKKLLTNRYHQVYCDKISKRMKWLAYKYRNSSCVLLTLTFDPKKFGNDKYEMWCCATSELDRFMQAMRMHFKRHDRVFPKYLWAPEAQKNGNIHFHIVFLGASRLLDWRKILSYWRNGFIYLNKTHEGMTVRYPINYVTGYITKTFGNTNFDNIQTQSLVWLFNLHSFNRSHGLVVPLNPKGCGDWELNYLAVVDKMENRLLELDELDYVLDVLLDPVLFKTGPPVRAKGKYVIYADDEEIVSTDSPFWASFFNGGD